MKDTLFLENMNAYDTIFVDIQACFKEAEEIMAAPNQYIRSGLINELKAAYPKFVSKKMALAAALESIYNQTGERFVIIFDEWDYPIRELDESSPDRLAYTEMLRGLFKNNAAKSYVRLSYLTGIMPIVRIKGQTAVNNFMEYTMTNPMDYNPLSVVRAISAKRFGQYWTVTGTYGNIDDLINKNFDGLRADIIRMLSGNRIPVNVSNGKNDLQFFKSKSEVITALIHLGYFAYDADAREAYVPNKEIQEVFYQYMENNESDNLSRFIRVSEKILNAVMERDAEETARQIQNVHNDFISGIEYNDENSLVCTITIALISAFRYYHKPIREFPCGRGFADIVYLPLQTQPNRPVLVVELKWNKSAQTAIAQIKKKQYPESLREYSGDILLVGIDYDKKTKEHYCVIESLGL